VEKKKKYRAGRVGFSSIQKTAPTGSSATGALVGANSLQPQKPPVGKLKHCIGFSV